MILDDSARCLGALLKKLPKVTEPICIPCARLMTSGDPAKVDTIEPAVEWVGDGAFRHKDCINRRFHGCTVEDISTAQVSLSFGMSETTAPERVIVGD